MFLQRAQAVQPDFALHMGAAASVVAICRRLDGLPLAIELAAARLNILPVDDLLARLDDRFQLLQRGRHAPTDRHQALQATIDRSYELLDPAAQAVCAGENVEAEAVLELLDELLDRSLVYVEVWTSGR